jgi:conjugative relaxase-like TrwC/TraI family protein
MTIGKMSYGTSCDYFTQGMSRGSFTSYYTGAEHQGEPPGTWSGPGAEKLGLTGEVKAEDMERLYNDRLDPRDPTGKTSFGSPPRSYKSAEARYQELLAKEPYALPERQRVLKAQASKSVQKDLAYAEYTYNVGKDITVQHTAAGYAETQAERAGRHEEAARYRHVRETIERAGHAGNAAALEHLRQNGAYARVGDHGAGKGGRWVPAKDWTVATFFQHTSRELDPQLHWHNPILLNTECDDGVVRKIHTETLKNTYVGATAVGTRVMQEMITEELGWRFQAVDRSSTKAGQKDVYELDNVDRKVADLFSERSRIINETVTPLVDAFVEHHGRAPTSLEIGQLRQKAALESRQAKPKDAEQRGDQLDRWDAEMKSKLGDGLDRQARTSLPADDRVPVPADEFSPSAVMQRAVARVQEKSTWTRSHLAKAVELELPPHLGVGPERVAEVIDAMVDRIVQDQAVQVTGDETATVPAAYRLDSGASSYIEPGSQCFTGRDTLLGEMTLERAAAARGRVRVDGRAVDQWFKDHAAMGLGEDQKAAIKGVMTTGAGIDTIIGPAGAGKTYTLGALSQAWSDLVPGGRVIGLATSEQATQVMRAENIQAKNIAQWLGAQERLAHAGEVQSLAHTTQRTRTPRGDDREWAVGRNDIIIPDEASMADRDALSKIHGYVEAAGAKMLPAGDTSQLGAVGQGGAMKLMAEAEGASVYELTEVRRFTNQWERRASLKLRDGDPAVLDEYEMHDRVRDSGTAEQAMKEAAGMYVGDRLAGKTAVVVCPTNKMAGQVNSMIRDELVKHGRVDEAGTLLERDGNMAGTGDMVRCRQNNWRSDLMLRNQTTYLVIGHGEDGSLKVREADTGREIDIPPAYKKEFVELGYATTVHGAQGSTVDTGIPIVSGGQSLESLYPAMTRGRERNTALVITEGERETYSGVEHLERVSPRVVLENIMTRENDEVKAALTLQREDAERAGSLRTVNGMYETAMRDFCRERLGRHLDQMVADDLLTPEDRVKFAADQGTEQLSRVMRAAEQAGHNPEEVLRRAVGSGNFGKARSVAQVTYGRVGKLLKGQLAPDPDLAVMPPAGAPAEMQEHFEQLTDIIREKRMALGEQVAEEAPEWATARLGEVPPEGIERAEWEHKAGVIAAHREASGWTDEREPLGPPPGMSRTEERAQWHAAWEAAGHPDTTAEEHEMTEGRLRCRVEAMARENATLPPSVHEQMQAVERALQDEQHAQAKLQSELEREVNDERRAELSVQVEEKEAEVAMLADKREQLQVVADEREALIEESAMTRDLGHRAEDELNERGIEVGKEPDRCTAEEWLAAEAQARVEDDEHRIITEENAPSEVYDAELDDLVQVADAVEDAPAVVVDEHQPAVDNVVDAVVVDEPEPVVPVAEEVAEPAERVDVVEAELVEPEVAAPAAVEREDQADVVDAEVVEPEPAAVPEPVAEVEEADEGGVPSQEEVDAAATATKVAVERSADRASEVRQRQLVEDTIVHNEHERAILEHERRLAEEEILDDLVDAA